MRNKIIVTQKEELTGRIPYKLITDDNGELLFKWIFIGTKKISEPFFDETISACLSLPENSEMPFTSAETLLERSNAIECAEPTAFIFHISRCGSTLLSQMLNLDERFVVLSEVPLLDELLCLSVSQHEKTKYISELYRAVLRIITEKRSGAEKFSVVKTDSWHLHFFETIRNIFPSVPAILLYRKPEEVIRSQQKFRGRHAVPGPVAPEVFGFDKSVLELFADEYLELVLKSYFEKCIQILSTDKNSAAISFHDGPMEMLSKTLSICEIEVSESVLEKMAERTKQHSKFPEQKFIEESPVENMNCKTLSSLFEKLEVIN
jgi:hypothetical protein